MQNTKYNQSIDKYISSFPSKTQTKLKQIRKTIKATTPQATEKISYGMPTFYLNGNLVHFAGYKKHIGFYPTPSGIKEFEKEISKYKHSKGAVQFPLDENLPIRLIKEIVNFRVLENLNKI
jgi:uncharacterized protein YdhG (YjbR/CyaY superfamily)